MNLNEQVAKPRLHHSPVSGKFTTHARPDIIQPDDVSLRLIALTQNQVATVDALVYDYFSQYPWIAWWSIKTQSYYAKRAEIVNGKQFAILMHRAIVGLEPGDKRTVDHKNQSTLDNRGANLRIATASQNISNSALCCKNKTGYKGVCLPRPYKRYLSQIGYRGTHIRIGSFESAVDAARAYDRKALELFGEFAWLNFPREDYL